MKKRAWTPPKQGGGGSHTTTASTAAQDTAAAEPNAKRTAFLRFGVCSADGDEDALSLREQEARRATWLRDGGLGGESDVGEGEAVVDLDAHTPPRATTATATTAVTAAAAATAGARATAEGEEETAAAAAAAAAAAVAPTPPTRCFGAAARAGTFASVRATLAAAKQTLVEAAEGAAVTGCEVVDSPHGAARAALGWGTVFAKNTARVTALLGPAGARVHIGTSSLNGTPNPGPTAVRDLKRLLSVYAAKFGALEHTLTYHSLPAVETFEAWARVARREGGGGGGRSCFRYCLKMSKLVTHDSGLVLTDDVRTHLSEFVRRARVLGKHLGPILFQLPPGFGRSEEAVARLEALATVLPTDLTFVFEFRNPSLYCAAVYAVLRRHNWATCVYHLTDERRDFTTPFADTCTKAVYIRLHGAVRQFCGDYGPAEMDAWAAFAAATCAHAPPGREVFVFFNNNESYAGKSEASRLCSSVADATYLAGVLNKAGGSSGSGTAAGVSTPPPSSPARVTAKKRQPPPPGADVIVL